MVTNLTKELIKNHFIKESREMINGIATAMYEAGMPLEYKIAFKGKTVSKVDKPYLWIASNRKRDGVCFKSNLVMDREDELYVADLLNYEFVDSIRESAEFAFECYSRNKEVDDWIENDMPCVYRHGWGYRGAGARTITKEQAKQMRPMYHFGKGFYELSWLEIEGKKYLEFNELSENDMW